MHLSFLFSLFSFNINSKNSVWEESYDKGGMLNSMNYICGLIDAEVEQSVPLSRIVLGGLIQGAVISFLAELGNRYAGTLDGVIGLSGSMPPVDLIENALELAKAGEGIDENAMCIFITYGTRDRIMPIKTFICYLDRGYGKLILGIVCWKTKTRAACL